MTAHPADNLATLFPVRELQLAGVMVTVHEYTLQEQLKHRQVLKALTDAFAGMVSATGSQEDIALDTLFDVLADKHAELLCAVAVSCSQPVEWVSALSGEDSELLMLTWWSVNAAFFTRAALRPQVERLAKQLLNGQKSSAT